MIENFNGPYIEHLPDIQVFELTPDDEFIVMATDGLWDFLSPEEVEKVVESYCEDKTKITNSLYKKTLKKAAFRANLLYEEVGKLPLGQIKRAVHDDITIMVVDLKKQIKKDSKNGNVNF
jgi:pyruvate dehydrogenase phosphatase